MTEQEKTIQTKSDGVVTYQIVYSKNYCSDSQSQQKTHTGVLLLHGLASNMTRWTEFVANTTLTQHFDLIRMDLRGHGKSMTYNRTTTAGWCDDINKIVMTEKYSRLVIVGHSLGAQVALQFAALYPNELKGLVLIDPVFPTALKGMLGVVRRLRYVLLGIIYLFLLKERLPFSKKELPYRDLHALDIKTREILNSDSGGDIAELYMNPYKDLVYIPLVNYFQDLFEVTRKIPDLKKIECEVLCLLSKGAAMSNIELTKSYVDQFPHSHIEIIDADHWLLTEKPDESRIAIDSACFQFLT